MAQARSEDSWMYRLLMKNDEENYEKTNNIMARMREYSGDCCENKFQILLTGFDADLSEIIVKGKEMSIGTIGTIILLFASILLMGGLLFYTSLYRKRGRLEDRLFFYLILVNIALTAGALLSYLLEYSSVPLARYLMILGNTVYYVALVFFAYLLFVYFDYSSDPEKTRMR